MREIVKRIPILNGAARGLLRYVRAKRGSRRLRRRVKQGGPLRLVIGSFGHHDPGWIDTEADYLNLVRPADWQAHFERGSIDAILAEHVWEHMTLEEGLTAAKVCFEYLKPGRYLRVAVPDGFHPSKEYIDYVKPAAVATGPGDHKVLYTHVTFADVFAKAGFRVQLLEHFDAEGRFHFADWSPADGTIRRSRRFDERNKDGELRYTSIILDAWKDG